VSEQDEEIDGRKTLELPLPGKPKRHPARSKYPPRMPTDPALQPLYNEGQLLIHRQKFLASPIGEIGTDPDGMITEANPALLRIFGRTASEIYDTNIFDYLDDESHAPLSEVIGRTVMSFSSIGERHVLVKRRDGSRVSCILSVVPIVAQNESGKDEVIRAIGFLRDQTELERNSKLDRKTGLLNQDTFFERVEEHVRISRKNDLGLAVAFIDLNKLKAMNRRYGHAEADRAIIKMAANLKEAIFAIDFAAHPHGDEFTVLFVSLERKDVTKVAERLVKAVSFDIDLLTRPERRLESVQVSAAIGIAWRKGAEINDAQDMLARANNCMHACKDNSHPYHLDLED
jgi:diguanylate cyclase (GGDEF)-like protein/PAS domain S-box-containing protein